MEEKRRETIAELENALEEIESGEGLSTFVEGHGLNSHRFRFEWSEPLLTISYDLPTGRALSPEEDQKADDAEAGAAPITNSELRRAVKLNEVAPNDPNIIMV